jgi:hypothetical protein
MKKKYSFVYFLLLIYFLPGKSQTLQQIGYYNVNGIFAMSSKANFMVLGNGQIVNISNPSLPNLTGSLGSSGFNSSVLVNGNYVYLGTGMSVNLNIADISNPSFPFQVGTLSFPSSSGGIFGLAKNGNVLYLAAGADGIYSVDISNVTNPVALDTIIFPSGQARDVITHGNFAYVAHTSGLIIVDIINPSAINVIATIGSGYYSIDIDTTNNLVFLGKDPGGIDVFNVSNPTLPVPAFAILNSGGTGWDVKYRDNLVYLATNSGGLFIYKITGGSSVQMANFPNTSNGQSFAVSLQDSLILLSGLINGVAILEYDSLGTTVINERFQRNNMVIFPNPASNYFEFDLNNEDNIEVEIINSDGKSVLKEYCTERKNRINISCLSKGCYIVFFRGRERTWQKKLIKSE